MTIRPLATRLLLLSTDFPPSRDDLEVIGAFNPGEVQALHGVVLLVRIVERPCEARPGFTGLPRWDPTVDSDRLGCE